MNKRKLQFDDIKLNKGKQQEHSAKEVISKKDIAIIGVAGRFPKADNIDEFWQILRNGVDCIRPFPETRRRDIDKYLKYSNLVNGKVEYCDLGFMDEIDKFDHNFFNIPLNEARVIDPNQRIFLETAWQAVEDAGYGGEKIMGTRTGVYVGYKSALSNLYQKYITDVKPNLLSLSMFGNKPHILAGRVSYFMNLKGPSMLIDTACSGSLISLHLACQSIRNGECEMALVGSIKLISIPVDGIDDKLGIESPDFRTRSFDDRSLGTGPGEGCAVIMIKPLYKAIEDRDNIYAVIKGTAANQDGRSAGLAVPNAEAQADVISQAWMDAGINPETIAHVETHGAGTVVGDPIEIDGLTRAFRKFTAKKQFCAVSAVKSNIGHLDNAATIAGLVKSILSLKHEELPPAANFVRPNRNINFIQSPVYVNHSLKEWKSGPHPRRCGVTGIGLNGTNCHVVLEEAPAIQREAGTESEPDIFTISARTEGALKNYIRDFKKFLIKNPSTSISDLCFTNNTGKGHYSFRLAFLFKGAEDFKNKLLKLNNLVPEKNNETEGVYYNATGSNREDSNREQSERIQEILHSCHSSGKDKQLLKELCSLYINGADIDWDYFYSSEKRNRISTPAYPFDKIRCWVEVPEKANPSIDTDSITALLTGGYLPDSLAAELGSVLEKCRPHIENLKEITENSPGLSGREGSEGEELSPLEKEVASIWRDYMGLDEIDIHRNFFQSGGDSIMALKIATAIKQRTDINVKVVDIAKNPTIHLLACFLEGCRVRQTAVL